MIFKKKYLFLAISLIVIFNTLLYTNNKQETSFRFFKWTIQEVSIGKLISISFFSGLFLNTLLNTSITSFNKNTLREKEDNYISQNNEEEMKSNVEMPPQRDIRDVQPTISVNYRVIKNTEEKNFKTDRNYSTYPDNKDDWYSNDNDW